MPSSDCEAVTNGCGRAGGGDKASLLGCLPLAAPIGLWVGGGGICCEPLPCAMGYRCVCTIGTVQHKAEVQSKSQREKLFSDMSRAPFAAVERQKHATCLVMHDHDPELVRQRPEFSRFIQVLYLTCGCALHTGPQRDLCRQAPPPNPLTAQCSTALLEWGSLGRIPATD